MQLEVDDRTKVLVDGQQAKPTDLQEGAQVRASPEGSGSDRTATSMEATKAGQSSGSSSSPGSSGSSGSSQGR